MTQLDERRRAMLARGLEAFDRTARRRRARRIAMPCAAALAMAASAAVLLHRVVPGAASGLPPSVELIVDDRDLAAELELARACERIDRTEGRLVVVECVAPPMPAGGRSHRDGGSIPFG